MRLTPQQQGYLDELTAFIEEVAGTPERIAALSHGGERLTDPDLLREMGARGLLGVSLPAADGGEGRSFVEECLLLETAARTGLPITSYSTSLTAAQTYLRWGTPEQRREVVSVVRAGGGLSVTFTEAGAGSDLSSVATSAERDGDGFVVNGRKTLISFAEYAAHLLLLARTDPTGHRHAGLTILMVPADSPGIEITPIDTIGPRMIYDVVLDGVRVPESAIVGHEHGAWGQIMRGLSVERLIIAAMSVGAAQRSLDATVDWVTRREQFGKALGRNQAVRHRLADLATEIAHCRAFVYDVADRIDAGEEEGLNREGSMAKLKATEVAKLAALESVQLTGGHGYRVDGGLDALVRFSLAPTIYGGSNEVQREIIGKSLGL